MSSSPVLLYVGRLASEKNVPLAFRAFEAVRARVPGVRFVVVGDGPLREKLARAHPEAIFAGPTTRCDAGPVLRVSRRLPVSEFDRDVWQRHA